ncbi:MAG: secretion protein HlyD [Chromatiaceae bacterium]
MKAFLRLLALVILIALIATVWWFWGRAVKGDSNLTLYGNVDIREVELAFRQPGRLESLRYEEGARVHQGDLLAELDARPYRDALAAANADYRHAAAELEKLRRGNRPQEIQRSEAEVALFTAMEKRLATELKRQKELAATAFTSQQELDKVRADYDEAVAGLNMAQQTQSLQREGARVEDISAAEASLAAAAAARDQAQTALDDTRLIAPADGIIMSRVLEPGSMVTSQTPVYTLALPDPVYVRAYAAEPQLGQMAPGTPVRVTTDSSSQVYAGHIGFVSPKAEFTPKSVETTALRTDLVYRLRIIIPKTDEGLRQGMPVTIQVLAAGHPGSP